MPNFPPQNWYNPKIESERNFEKSINTVYVGALSLKDTYIEEYCEWVILQNGRITFDIYSYNLHLDTFEYLKRLRSPFINFYDEGIDYESLPVTLSNYSIGLILYKGSTPNYVYNAPNKLFEYLACGLRVVFPDVMKGIYPYASEIVKPIEFTKIPSISFFLELDREPFFFQEKYSAERATAQLVSKLTNHMKYN
ncbi:hypothetical protein GCM10008106_17980 [Mongoliitalea lutea]|uniref:Uncharacterized protein n=2 Tax=Mongoliitalea lutea TaxID=849756 RepID=A0A8J3CZ22_9BACT|nr:hypothetical protein GCM10008106_17980 [Mongoliitalea lutea]